MHKRDKLECHPQYIYFVMKETFHILKTSEKHCITVTQRKLGRKTKRKTEKEQSEKQPGFFMFKPKSEFCCLFEVFYSLLTENDKA